jgi:hypothetical protein
MPCVCESLFLTYSHLDIKSVQSFYSLSYINHAMDVCAKETLIPYLRLLANRSPHKST